MVRVTEVSKLQRAALRWYRVRARDLPWRRTRDPYRILVSEVMLQQTQVDRVVPKYGEFLKRFPTLRALARARLADVLRACLGLGYNGRARRLWECARTVTGTHHGRLPKTEAALRSLPGFGRYTAAALACFAFGQRVAVVDTNVRRVLGRVVLRRDAISQSDAWRLAEAALPANAYAWNQALMDIGARFCRKTPNCEPCPLKRSCAWALRPPRALSASELRSERYRSERYSKAPDSERHRYEGSRRQHRGRVIRSLASVPKLSLARLGPQVKEDYCESDLPWLRGLLRDLARDGLVVLDRSECIARLP